MVNYIGMKANLNNKDEAHLTLFILPQEIDTTVAGKIQAILDEFRYYSIGARFKSFDNFGPAKDVPVIRVQNEILFNAIRKRISDIPLVDQSSYDFAPHISIPPDMDPIIIPKIIPLSGIFFKAD